MKKAKSIGKLSFFIFLFSIFSTQPVYATCGSMFALDFRCINNYYQKTLEYALAVSILYLIVIIIMAGFKWLTSSGDSKDIENAKGRITFAIMGLLIIIGSWFILTFISQFIFGVNQSTITQFNFP
jgi:hypothetical protein